MKAILISIRPEHVANILKGYKILEIRKSRPGVYKKLKKCEALKEPLEVYIYCTKGPDYCYHAFDAFKLSDKRAVIPMQLCNGKVVAKFTLNKVEKIIDKETKIKNRYSFGTESMQDEELINKSCLTIRELCQYISKGEKWVYGEYGYAWHIDNLVIFDEPKELSEFKKCYRSKGYPQNQSWYLTRAPESWCWIEVEK